MSIANAKTDNNAPPQRGEEVEVYKWWANRKGEAIITKLVELDGRWFIDIRRSFSNSSGRFSPTQRGVMVPVRKIPDFVKAETAAQERNMLAQDDGGAQ
jgi:hypothetical protein